MFRFAFPFLLVIALALPGITILGSGLSAPAFAEGGRGPKDSFPGVKPAKKSKKRVAPAKRAAKTQDPAKFVPATTMSRHDSVDYIQEDLEAGARRDNLGRMAGSRKRIAALRAHIDTAFIATQDGKARNEPNLIFAQLNRYRSQKTNKQLRGNAAIVLGAVAADRADAKARDLLTRYRAAAKAGQGVKAALLKGDYDDARAEYYSRVRRLPEASRGMFSGLPRDPGAP